MQPTAVRSPSLNFVTALPAAVFFWRCEGWSRLLHKSKSPFVRFTLANEGSRFTSGTRQSTRRTRQRFDSILPLVVMHKLTEACAKLLEPYSRVDAVNDSSE